MKRYSLLYILTGLLFMASCSDEENESNTEQEMEVVSESTSPLAMEVVKVNNHAEGDLVEVQLRLFPKPGAMVNKESEMILNRLFSGSANSQAHFELQELLYKVSWLSDGQQMIEPSYVNVESEDGVHIVRNIHIGFNTETITNNEEMTLLYYDKFFLTGLQRHELI